MVEVRLGNLLSKMETETYSLQRLSEAVKSDVETVKPMVQQLCLSGLLHGEMAGSEEVYRVSHPKVSSGQIHEELTNERRWSEVEGWWVRAWRAEQSRWEGECTYMPGLLVVGYDRVEVERRVIALARRFTPAKGE